MSVPTKMLTKPAPEPVDPVAAAELAETEARAALDQANAAVAQAEERHREATAARGAATVDTSETELGTLIARQAIAADRCSHASKAAHAALQRYKAAEAAASNARWEERERLYKLEAVAPIMQRQAEIEALWAKAAELQKEQAEIFLTKVWPRNPKWYPTTIRDAVPPPGFFQNVAHFVNAHRGFKVEPVLTGNILGDWSLRKSQADSEHVMAKGPAPELPFVGELDDEQRDRLYASLNFYGLGFVAVCGLKTGVGLGQLYKIAGAPEGQANQTSAPVDLDYDDLARLVHFAHVTTENRLPGGWDPVAGRSARVGRLAGARLAARLQSSTTTESTT